MKTKITILVMYFSVALLNAQDFSTKFYLTDKHGTKDSLVLGYSSTASFGLDTQYGEVGYTTPVNSNKFGASIIINGSNKVLSQIIYNKEINSFSKKQIVPLQETAYIEQNAIGIMVPIDSLPITVSWDKSQFADTQRNYSLITDWKLGGWFDAGDGNTSFLGNLKDINSVQVKDRIANYLFSDGTNQYPMYIFYIAFANSKTMINGVNVANAGKPISVYPSVTNSYVYIRNNTANRIIKTKILSLSGKLIETIEDNQTSIELSKYPNGIYLLGIETSENISYFKIIKK